MARRLLWYVAGIGLLLSFAVAGGAEPSMLEMILASKASLVFQRASFGEALERLQTQVRIRAETFHIKVIDKDLKLEGITRNQSLRDFQQEDKTAAEILTALVIAANPDRAVTEASDPRLQLIWIVGSDPDSLEREVVLITTRNSAKMRGDKLPEIFRTAAQAR